MTYTERSSTVINSKVVDKRSIIVTRNTNLINARESNTSNKEMFEDSKRSILQLFSRFGIDYKDEKG